MEKIEFKKIPIDTKDVYQMLISECRYGYSRNNHLMPDGTYDKCKRILPDFYQVDASYAIHTAQQLLEECISDELCTHFPDGIDDELGNRRNALRFIDWLFAFITPEDPNWKPYNYAQYLENVAHDDDKLFAVYDITDPANVIPLTENGLVSVKEYMDVIYKYIDDLADSSGALFYTKENKIEDNVYKMIYHIQSPLAKTIVVERSLFAGE